METVLLATDGSEYARSAADRAIDLAKAEGATLYVICVVDRQRFEESGLSSAELATIWAEDYADVCVKEVTKMAEGTDVVVEGDVRHGIPHEVILAYADEVGADVIVVGEHGDHTKHFAGVGRKVDERADCEVIVVTAAS